MICQESLPGERASALDFKDAAAPRFGHSDVVFVYFFVTNIKTCRLQSSTKMLNKRNLWYF